MLCLGRAMHEVPCAQRPLLAFDDQNCFARNDEQVLLIGLPVVHGHRLARVQDERIDAELVGLRLVFEVVEHEADGAAALGMTPRGVAHVADEPPLTSGHAAWSGAPAATGWSRVRPETAATSVTTAQARATQAHACPWLPAAAAGASRHEIAHAPAAIAALAAGIPAPDVPRPARRTSSRTATATAAITVQWCNPFDTASAGVRPRRCAEAIRDAYTRSGAAATAASASIVRSSRPRANNVWRAGCSTTSTANATATPAARTRYHHAAPAAPAS